MFAVTEVLSLSVYKPIAKEILQGGTFPQFGGEGRARGVACGTPRKSSVLGKICLLEPKRYLSPLTSQSQKQILVGGTVPQLGEEVELEGRVWHPAKVLRIR